MLHTAAALGDVAYVTPLLYAGVSVDCADIDGKSTNRVVAASRRGGIEGGGQRLVCRRGLTTVALVAGAPAVAPPGTTPLMAAVRGEQHEMVMRLLVEGANPRCAPTWQHARRPRRN